MASELLSVLCTFDNSTKCIVRFRFFFAIPKRSTSDPKRRVVSLKKEMSWKTRLCK